MVNPAEKEEAGKAIVVVWESVLSAVTEQADAVPWGQSTVRDLCDGCCQLSFHLTILVLIVDGLFGRDLRRESVEREGGGRHTA